MSVDHNRHYWVRHPSGVIDCYSCAVRPDWLAARKPCELPMSALAREQCPEKSVRPIEVLARMGEMLDEDVDPMFVDGFDGNRWIRPKPTDPQ